MCRWRTWWRGLPALAGLVILTILFARESVEQGLDSRAEALLTAVGESWAKAHFEGRNAVLEGEALSEEARVKVRMELARLSGVREVEDRTTILPMRRPFTFTAIRDGSKLHLEGYVPSSYARRRIAEAAADVTPGVVVTGVQELVRARGVPAGDFIGVVEFGIKQLSKMPAGRITISDDAFSIEGRAPNFTVYDAMEVTVRSELPGDFKLARFAVLPPVVSPYVWSAAREPGGVQLSGYIPLGDARRALLDMVRDSIPGAAISDRLRLADGAPPTDGWLRAVSFALGQLGRLPDGKVALSGTTISVEGTAPDYAAYDAVAGARRTIPEGYTLTRFAVEPPKASPFVWSVRRGGDGIRLTGYAPSEDAKRLLLDAVRGDFPGVPITDEMRIAAGGPPAEDWVVVTNFGVDQLSKLRIGSVSGKDSTLSISGEAQDSAAYISVHGAMEQAPARSFTLASDVRPPLVSPYVFSLRKDEAGLTISGFYPSLTEHRKLLEQAKLLFPGLVVNDVSAVAFGSPKGFSDVVGAALHQLARLGTGEARLDDAKLIFTGTVLYPAAEQAIRAGLKQAMPKEFTLELDFNVATWPLVDPATCQKAINALLAQGGVVFKPNGTRIEAVSNSVLDHVVATIASCPETMIEISADQTGIMASLAEARAKSIMKYLAEAGISPERLLTAPRSARADEKLTSGSGVQLIVR